mgnify:CR=1 FL=1
MKKKNFVSMIMGIVGGIPFAIGMCMCLIAEWGAFDQGIVVAAAGLVVLLAMVIVRRKMEGKKAVVLNGRVIGITLFGAAGALTLGVGMCMTMVWTNLMIWGIIVGCIGIVLLLCLIPLCRGIK